MLNEPRAQRPMRRWALLALIVMLVSGLPAWAAEPERDPKAVELAEKVLDAMGGKERWEATRFLRFDFFGFRLHHWDRETGRHRLEGTNREGVGYVVLHDVNSRQGDVWLNGEKLAEGEDKAQWLERAYGAWINDTYWLVMPTKLLDPGVHLKYAGQEELENVNYDKVELSFDSVGLTPGDRYWAYINPKTGLMDRWAYHLQNWEADREPTVWIWSDWQSYSGIKLASKRIQVGDGSVRSLGKIAVFGNLADSVFTSPEPVAD